MADNTLILPSAVYDPAHERQRNRRIEELLRNKANKEQQLIFTGVPHAVLGGDNAAFSTPGGNVITILPYPLALIDNPELVHKEVDNNYYLKPVYEVSMALNYVLQHVSGSGGTTQVTLYLYRDGVQEVANTRTLTLNDNDVMTGTFFVGNVPPDKVIDFRISHTGSQPMVLNMQRARLWFMQMSPNPFYVSGGRYGTTGFSA
jgi:hypothetical protein